MHVRTAAPVRGGAVDADVLRQRWPEVLDAVKGQRRIAWMLLSPASVDSLEGGVLTVAFPREGEAKGFASSGCDQVLAGVLGTMLGLNVRVRAVVGAGTAGPGPRASSRRATADAPVPGAGGSEPATSAAMPDAVAGAPEAGPGSAAPRRDEALLRGFAAAGAGGGAAWFAGLSGPAEPLGSFAAGSGLAEWASGPVALGAGACGTGSCAGRGGVRGPGPGAPVPTTARTRTFRPSRVPSTVAST